MNFLIQSDYDQLSAAAARAVADAVRSAPSLRLCLPAGKTPLGLYRELVRMHRTQRLDFSRVKMFQLDEYVGLRPNHPARFESCLWQQFFNYVNVRRANVHLIDENYEQTIRTSGGIDLLILGIGVNGHIAFNEPGAALDTRTRTVALDASTIDALRSTFKPEELPREALTVGIATILEARRILLLASGEKKAEILARALRGPVDSAVPATALQMHPDVTVLADLAAARLYNPS